MRRFLVLGAAVCLSASGSLAAAGYLGSVTPKQLRLMVLPLRQLELEGTSPKVAFVDSAVLTNSTVASKSFGGETASEIARLGRITGYGLYFLFSSNALPKPGLLEAGTDVSLFRDPASARSFLARRVGDLQKAVGKARSGVGLDKLRTFAVKALRDAIGVQFVESYGKARTFRLYATFVSFTSGSLVAEAAIVRRDGLDVRATLIANAGALDKRMTAVLSGHAPS